MLPIILILAAVAAMLIVTAIARTPIRRGMHRFAGVVGGFQVRDANLKVVKALPNGAATIYSDAIDLAGGTLVRADFLANVELLLTAPLLAFADLGDAATMKFLIQTDNDSAFGSPKSLIVDAIVQTGADGAGAAAATHRFRLPTDAGRYIRFGATNSAAGDASDKSATLEVLA